MKTLVVAPHPDDETLGAGGTLLRYKYEGKSIAWLIISGITEDLGWSSHDIAERNKEIAKVSDFFNFDEVYNLKFPTTKLETLPTSELIKNISNVIQSFKPSEILIPHLGDIHTDHHIVHQAVLSCTKWFRYPFVQKIMSYETLSETDFGLNFSCQFCPNVFIDISNYLEKKIEIMKIYSSEMGEFPFPRSTVSIQSLARIRGTSSGFNAAEAFQLLRERI